MDPPIPNTNDTFVPDVNETPPTNNVPVNISVPNADSNTTISNSCKNTSTLQPHNPSDSLHPRTYSNNPDTVTITQTQQSDTTYNQPTSNDDGLITVHHEDKIYTLLSHLCLPVNQTPLNDNYVCKFPNRDCVMKRCKIFDGIGSKNLPELSETVFSPPRKLAGTLKYAVVDCRIIKCCQPRCTNGLDQNPKLFHFSCFIHSLSKSDNKGMNIISLTDNDDKLLSFLNVNEPVLSEVKTALRNGSNVIFPCCGKRCHKIVAASRLETKQKSCKKYATSSSPTSNGTTPNWDKDGTADKRSSIRILIDWMTTEEHATKYFGGLDKDGRTSSDRKESYHNYISDLIKKENGEY